MSNSLNITKSKCELEVILVTKFGIKAIDVQEVDNIILYYITSPNGRPDHVGTWNKVTNNGWFY